MLFRRGTRNHSPSKHRISEHSKGTLHSYPTNSSYSTSQQFLYVPKSISKENLKQIEKILV